MSLVGRLVVRIRSAKSLHVAIWIGLGGLGLMGGNLLLAGVLSPDDFGRLSLFEAILAVAVGVGGLGIDKLSVRFEVGHDWRTVLLTAIAASAAGVLGGLLAWLIYGLSATAMGLIAAGSVGGAVGRVLAAFDQAHVRLNRSQLVYQSPFLFFLVGGLVLTLGREDMDWLSGATALTAGYVVSSLIGLLIQRGSLGKSEAAVGSKDERLALIGRGLSFVGITGSVLTLNQLERLVIPGTISLEALANFTLVATLVGSPFKLLQGGIGYALTPQLQQAETASLRRHLLRREFRLGLIISILASVVLLPAALPVIGLLYGDKYSVSFALVLVVLLSGWVRMLHGLASSAVSGLANNRELRLFNLFGWGSVGAAGLLAVALSGLGAVGVVIGATAGWGIRIVVAIRLLRDRFRDSDSEPGRRQDATQRGGPSVVASDASGD